MGGSCGGRLPEGTRLGAFGDRGAWFAFRLWRFPATRRGRLVTRHEPRLPHLEVERKASPPDPTAVRHEQGGARRWCPAGSRCSGRLEGGGGGDDRWQRRWG